MLHSLVLGSFFSPFQTFNMASTPTDAARIALLEKREALSKEMYVPLYNAFNRGDCTYEDFHKALRTFKDNMTYNVHSADAARILRVADMCECVLERLITSSKKNED